MNLNKIIITILIFDVIIKASDMDKQLATIQATSTSIESRVKIRTFNDDISFYTINNMLNSLWRSIKKNYKQCTQEYKQYMIQNYQKEKLLQYIMWHNLKLPQEIKGRHENFHILNQKTVEALNQQILVYNPNMTPEGIVAQIMSQKKELIIESKKSRSVRKKEAEERKKTKIISDKLLQPEETIISKRQKKKAERIEQAIKRKEAVVKKIVSRNAAGVVIIEGIINQAEMITMRAVEALKEAEIAKTIASIAIEKAKTASKAQQKQADDELKNAVQMADSATARARIAEEESMVAIAAVANLTKEIDRFL